MRFWHRLVCQYGLAHVVGDGEDVQHMGALRDIDVDKVTGGAGLTGFDGFRWFSVVVRLSCFPVSPVYFVVQLRAYKIGARLHYVDMAVVLSLVLVYLVTDRSIFG